MRDTNEIIWGPKYPHQANEVIGGLLGRPNEVTRSLMGSLWGPMRSLGVSMKPLEVAMKPLEVAKKPL